jgi:hypothetical protein
VELGNTLAITEQAVLVVVEVVGGAVTAAVVGVA